MSNSYPMICLFSFIESIVQVAITTRGRAYHGSDKHSPSNISGRDWRFREQRNRCKQVCLKWSSSAPQGLRPSSPRWCLSAHLIEIQLEYMWIFDYSLLMPEPECFGVFRRHDRKRTNGFHTSTTLTKQVLMLLRCLFLGSHFRHCH